jgi:hypothetical protein
MSRNQSGPAALSTPNQTGVVMDTWTDEGRLDPIVIATALFGVVIAAIMVTAI